ncbi:hypothetical protein [Calothrix sp. PCC 7507]|uniref:hypothetical protein n=1 Tax=Calothrix sp. PCC 7507 TaxID=99598 RepID=UPI00029F3DE6|nr:hypothetical protein [Calothrix sp. PCC 7507]AFY31440.1 hypothetical protein Cal7507_0961 [Calothrix sp. PCC 7507]
MADVNGTWLGTYWQQGIPSRFEAVLVQSGKTLSGSILDDNYLGEAHLNGEVIGQQISFTKSYLITSPAPIKYTGTLSDNEDYMQGRWNIGRRHSGTWEARRSGDNLMADLQARLKDQTSLSNG